MLLLFYHLLARFAIISAFVEFPGGRYNGSSELVFYPSHRRE